jgi:hypothetical protein
MDFNYERPTFFVDGITFQFKKSSPQNRKAVYEYYQDLVDEYGETVDEISEKEEVEDIDLEQQSIESMKEMIGFIAEPTEYETKEEAFEEINWEYVDQKKIQAAMNYFLE